MNPCSFIKDAPSSQQKLAHASALSILLSPGLLIIDHIHFQYNGFLYGILVLSLLAARRQSTALLSGILFAGLLCLKHIYLYLAPAYFVYLLRTYCLSPRSIYRIRFANCAKLGAGLAVVFGLAFGPFVFLGQTEQLIRRLFPFSRGLCHAYWAPNVWAIYSFIDRVLLLGKHNVTVFETLTDSLSCSENWASNRRHGASQRDSRSGWRFLVRDSAGDHASSHLPTYARGTSGMLDTARREHPLTSIARTLQTFCETGLDQLHRCCDPLWLRVIPVRLARARKGHTACHHPLQSDSSQGSTIFRSLSTVGCSGIRFPLPSPIHTPGIPHQDGLYLVLAKHLPRVV